MAVVFGESRAVQAARPRVLAWLASLPTQRHRIALGLVLIASAALEFIGLTDEQYANTYYAAAVKSMLTSWHNFFFVSSDAGGFVSVDKPPLGLWIETISAKIFGFNSLSLLAPEALAGVLSVALLYKLIARPFGQVAGLTAALVLAVTPVTAVTDRNNTIDSLLILTLLLGAWAASRAAETGRLRWLLLSAVLVGLGFNIKMMQAYLVIPAFALAYGLGAPIAKRARLGGLALSCLVGLVVSLSWAVWVDLTPVADRPYVSDSGTNSALSLALGYNGLGRVTQALFSGLSGLHIGDITIDLNVIPAFAPNIGNPSVYRLINPVLAQQASWLLPMACIGLLAAILLTPRRLPIDLQGQALVLWAGWLATAMIFFSTARFFHLYYLVMLAPPVAALAGIGVASLWKIYDQAGRAEATRLHRSLGWLLPAALIVTAWLQVHTVEAFPGYASWLTPVIVGLTVVAALVLAARLLRLQVQTSPGILVSVTRPIALGAAVLGAAAVLIGPSTWATISVANGNGGAWLPQAGPGSEAGGPGGGRGGFGGGGARQFQPGQGFANRSGRTGRGGGAGAGTPSTGSSSAGNSGTRPGGTAGSGTGVPGQPGSSSPGNSIQPGAGGSGSVGTVGGAGAGGGFTNGRGTGGGFGGAGGFSAGGGFGGGGFGGGAGGAMTFAGNQVPTLPANLLSYLLANQKGAKFLVATTTSSYASLFILQTNQPAMALGGYQGWDHILTPAQLAQDVASNVVRYFYIPAGGNGGVGGGGRSFGGSPGASSSVPSGDADATGDLTAWVRANCSLVPSTSWESTTGGAGRTSGGLQLYGCTSSAKP